MRFTDSNLIDNVRRAYLIGIGGVGMSALARVLKHQGLEVSGSDSKESRTTRDLTRAGIRVHIGQSQVGFRDEDLIIYSSAIMPNHIELRAARESGRRVHHRAEVLSSLLNRARTSVAVTGTHGKTTTSSMISFVLAELGKNPTCLVGGDVMNLGTNTVLGNSDLWVSEVDESDKSHELYAPNYTIITNLEEDHIDNYKNLDDLKSSFLRFFENTRNPGLLIYNAEDTVLSKLVLESGKPRLSFGFSEAADFRAERVKMNDFGSEFARACPAERAGHAQCVQCPGRADALGAAGRRAV
jgi:UDP-N-acetylmuramate--alanine ligase